jgi:hypothetical protein
LSMHQTVQRPLILCHPCVSSSVLRLSSLVISLSLSDSLELCRSNNPANSQRLQCTRDMEPLEVGGT